MTLSPYEQWMVKSNLETISATNVTAQEQAARLRANGYPRVADAVIAHATRTRTEAITHADGSVTIQSADPNHDA